jgi:hypothetical protein
MNPQEILELIRAGGITGLLIFALIGGFRRWWVFGWHYKEVVRDRDEWKSLAMGGTHLAERSVKIAREVVEGTTNGS